MLLDMRQPFRQIPDFDELGWVEFWAQVDRKGEDECWPWMGYTNRGYGMFYYGGQSYYAHRVTYTKLVGPIPDGLTIDHVYRRGCRLKKCANPGHMEPVTQKVNTERGLEIYWEKKLPRPDRCVKGHKREIGKPCRKCAVLAVAKSIKKKPEKYGPMKTAQKRKERCRWRGVAMKCVVCGKDYLTAKQHCGSPCESRPMEPGPTQKKLQLLYAKQRAKSAQKI